MVKQIKGMSDTQVQWMLKATTYVQSALRAVQRAREFVLSRTFLLIALVVLLIAVLLRHLGVM